jgi:hypothetical protein
VGSGRAQSHGVAIIANGRNLVYGFPDKVMCKMRYNEFVSVTSTTGSVGKYLFRMNSCFDPNFTGTGHQPLYYDTYNAIYDHYAVVSSRIIVKIMNTSTAPLRVGLLFDDDSSTSSTIETLCEQSHGTHVILPPQTGSLSTHTFRMNWNCKKILGIDPFASETYKTAVTSNPTEESYACVWGATGDASTATIYLDVVMEFEVLFTELTTPTQS